MSWAVRYSEASEARKLTRPARSSGLAMRPCGMRATQSWCSAGSWSRIACVRSVRTYPGETELTRMPARAHSTASDLPRWTTAAFEALYDAAHCGTLTIDPDIDAMKTALPGMPAL